MRPQGNTGEWDNLQKTILGMFGGTIKTNAQVYRNGPEAMRAWLASRSRLSFDQWLQDPAIAVSTTGESHT